MYPNLVPPALSEIKIKQLCFSPIVLGSSHCQTAHGDELCHFLPLETWLSGQGLTEQALNGCCWDHVCQTPGVFSTRLWDLTWLSSGSGDCCAHFPASKLLLSIKDDSKCWPSHGNTAKEIYFHFTVPCEHGTF